ATFYITIVFAAAYFAYYELGPGPTLKQEMDSEVAVIDAQKKASGPQKQFPEEARLLAVQKDPQKRAAGKSVFQARCVSCHGEAGQGLIGPNLTDDYWLHGDGKIGSIAKVVHDGVPEKGMPPWGALLSDEEVYAVTAYVKSLRGTKPAGAKAPQGQLVKE